MAKALLRGKDVFLFISAVSLFLMATSSFLLGFGHVGQEAFCGSMPSRLTQAVLNEQPAMTETPMKRPKKLGDGCYHVFLDVGSNIGIHARFLMEPHLYSKSLAVNDIFAREFGPAPRDNRDFCIFSFEPNPAHRQRHLDLQAAYDAMGWRYVPFHAGVGDTDGNMTVNYVSDTQHRDWGFSFLRNTTSKDKEEASETPARQVLELPVKRLATFLREEILGRAIPHPRQTTMPPKVVMKLDVEGMELMVLPDLLITGVLCETVDFMFGELSHCKQGELYPVRNPKNGKLVAEAGWECNRLTAALLRFLDASPNCATRYTVQDDESYLHDGKPFPVSNASRASE